MTRPIRAGASATRLALGALGLAAACNPGAFSDLEEDIWVDSTGAPDNLRSDDYGAAVAFAGTTGAGASIVVVSREPAGVVQLDYDESGVLDRRLQILNQKVPGLVSLTEPAIIATEPAGFDSGARNVAIAATDEDGVPYGVLYSAKTFEFAGTPIAFGTTGGAPTALALGPTGVDAVAGQPALDLVALAAGQLWIAQDYAAGGPPILRTCQPSRARSLIAADIDAAAPGEEIVLATADGLRYLLATDVPEVPEVPDGVEIPSCPMLDLAVDETGLGEALVAGDFDGNGEEDVAVGAPGENVVHVLWNGRDHTEVAGPSESVSFGDAVAAGDLDRDGNADLVVADSAFGGEATGGGAVYIVRSTGDDFDGPIELHDADPEKNQRFGRSIAIASWNGEDDILVVAASDEVFTYFRLPLADSRDVRER